MNAPSIALINDLATGCNTYGALGARCTSGLILKGIEIGGENFMTHTAHEVDYPAMTLGQFQVLPRAVIWHTRALQVYYEKLWVLQNMDEVSFTKKLMTLRFNEDDPYDGYFESYQGVLGWYGMYMLVCSTGRLS